MFEIVASHIASLSSSSPMRRRWAGDRRGRIKQLRHSWTARGSRPTAMPNAIAPRRAETATIVYIAAVASLLLCSVPGPARAGFACLSSPCEHGVCVDQLNRWAILAFGSGVVWTTYLTSTMQPVLGFKKISKRLRVENSPSRIGFCKRLCVKRFW